MIKNVYIWEKAFTVVQKGGVSAPNAPPLDPPCKNKIIKNKIWYKTTVKQGFKLKIHVFLLGLNYSPKKRKTIVTPANMLQRVVLESNGFKCLFKF